MSAWFSMKLSAIYIRKEFHAKAQRRKESTQAEEAFDSFASLRLCVRLPFSSSRLKLNHYARIGVLVERGGRLI